MSDLTGFLLARLGEDEATARAAAATPTGTAWRNDEGTVVSDGPEVVDWVYMPVADHIVRWNPARVLAECEARRRIVKKAAVMAEHYEPADPDSWEPLQYLHHEADEDLGRWLLATLAAPYSGHPDFDPSWAVLGE